MRACARAFASWLGEGAEGWELSVAGWYMVCGVMLTVVPLLAVLFMAVLFMAVLFMAVLFMARGMRGQCRGCGWVRRGDRF
jgi:hypothetical protein